MADRESTGRSRTTEAGTKRMSPWLRRVSVVVIFLLAGAIINVLVAWGCALLLRAYDPAGPPTYPPTHWVYEQDGLMFVRIEVYQYWGKGTIDNSRQPGVNGINRRLGSSLEQRRRATADLPHWARGLYDVDEPFDVDRQLIGSGFPLYSFRAELHGSYRFRLGTGAIDATSISIGKEISNAGILRVIPVDPIWPGVLLNTTFYGAILWLLFAPVGLIRRAVRRHRRSKRSQCPACAYPVGVSPVCPECGEAVKAVKAV